MAPSWSATAANEKKDVVTCGCLLLPIMSGLFTQYFLTIIIFRFKNLKKYDYALSSKMSYNIKS